MRILVVEKPADPLRVLERDAAEEAATRSKDFLYFVSGDTLIRLFRAVGLADVVEVQWRRGVASGMMRVVKATRGKSVT